MSTLAEVGTELARKMGDLQSLLESASSLVREQIRAAVAAGEPAIGKDEAAKVIGCHVSTLERRMTQKNPPPHYKDGGRVTFYATELRAWKTAYRVGRVPAQSPAETN